MGEHFDQSLRLNFPVILEVRPDGSGQNHNLMDTTYSYPFDWEYRDSLLRMDTSVYQLHALEERWMAIEKNVWRSFRKALLVPVADSLSQIRASVRGSWRYTPQPDTTKEAFYTEETLDFQGDRLLIQRAYRLRPAGAILYREQEVRCLYWARAGAYVFVGTQGNEDSCHYGNFTFAQYLARYPESLSLYWPGLEEPLRRYQRVDSLSQDGAMSVPFTMVNADRIPRFYHIDRQPTYRGGPRAVRQALDSLVSSPPPSAHKGILRFRFVVNQQGQKGRFSLQGCTYEGQPLHFEEGVMATYFQALLQLKDWVPAKGPAGPYDAWRILSLHLDQGAITELEIR